MKYILPAVAALLLFSPLANAAPNPYTDDNYGPWVAKAMFSIMAPSKNTETYSLDNFSQRGTNGILRTPLGATAEIGYFLHDRVSINSSLGWLFNTDYKITGTTWNPINGTFGSSTTTGHINIVPLTAVVQYHYPLFEDVVPYIGIGGHYTFVPSTFKGVKYEMDPGFVAQAGIDWWTNRSLGINTDIRFYQMKLTGDYKEFTGMPITSTLNMNPVVFSAGIAMRF
jgi:outer membrane protein W